MTGLIESHKPQGFPRFVYGRQNEIADLCGRARYAGITIVTARPRTGKTFLLRAVKTRLEGLGFLCGYAEATSGASNLPMMAFRDLHRSWFEDASLRRQAKAIAATAKEQRLRLLEPLLDASSLFDVLASPFRAGFEADRAVRTGGILLETVDRDRALAVSQLASSVLPERAQHVIFLDAFEQQGDAGRAEALKLLRAIRDRFADDWKHLHVFIGSRPADPVGEELRKARSSLLAEIRQLGDLELTASERTALVAEIRSVLGWQASDADDEAILDVVDSSPRFIDQLGFEARRAEVKTLEDLSRLARRAEIESYELLRQRLDQLEGDARRFAIRLAFLPELNDPEMQKAVEPIARGDLSDSAIHQVKDRLLERGKQGSLSWGHTTRFEAAREHLIETLDAAVEGEVLGLKRSIAAAFSPSNEREWWSLLMAFAVDVDKYCPKDLELARELWIALRDQRPLSDLDQHAGSDFPQELGSRLLVAILLHDAHLGAVNHEVWEHAAGWLDELRRLHGAEPGDAAVRERLAQALFNAHVGAMRREVWEHAAGLLDELRRLHGAEPDDAAVRERLAQALYNAHLDAGNREAWEHAAGLLDELRRLHGAEPGDAAVREQLAMALYNAHWDAVDSEGWDYAVELLDELRTLHGAEPGDVAVRMLLAMALLTAQADAVNREGWDHASGLLAELRRLHGTEPSDAAVREQLAKALFVAHLGAESREGWDHAAGWLDELHTLQRQFPDDSIWLDERMEKLLSEKRSP